MTEQELAALRGELDTVRRTNAELVTKNSTRKQRIGELETTVADLQTQLATANGRIQEMTIGVPLRAMAEEISTCPTEWQEAFGKHYRLELANGELTIVSTADGKPVTKEGKPVPFEREALKALLLDEKHPQSKLMGAILIASRASGSGATSTETRRAPVAPKPTLPSFGLR